MAELKTLARQLRERLGWNQAEMARQLGLSQATISQRESGAVGIPPDELHRMARLAGVALVLGDAGWEIVEPGSKEEAIALAARREERLREEVEQWRRKAEPMVRGRMTQRNSDVGSTDWDDPDEMEFEVTAAVGAGPGQVADETAERMTVAALKWYNEADDLVLVRGSSMEPMYFHGDVVGVKFCDERAMRQGRVVVARWRDDGASIIKVYRGQYEGRLHLQSLNPHHEIILGEPGELEIIGKPFGCMRMREVDVTF